MKRPSFQFYPSDWLRDTALRTCSCEARGLWMDMICFMHEGTPYGYLKVNRKVILPSNLAVMVGVNLQDAERLLAELEECGVFERDEEGCIFSKRMVRDESLRNARAQGGKLGGNPALVKGKVNLKDNHKVENEDKQNPTPSSSSLSSFSSSKTPIAMTQPIGWSLAGGWTGISDDDRKEWQEAYPACDLTRQFAAMTQWLKSNPKKAVKSQWRKFITSWLSRAQDRGGDIPSTNFKQKGATPDGFGV
jgi:hypothetical protein